MTAAVHASAFERVLDRLGTVTGMLPRGGGRQRMARCPHHDDTTASLSVTDGNDRVLLKCHAGCDNTDIVDDLGLQLADLFNEPRDPAHLNGSRPAVIAEYEYRDEEGKLLYVVERKHPKTFVCKQPDGRGGWTYTMKGARRVLYRLPDIVVALRANHTIYVVEGEKDADRLAALGHTATCNPHGAGKWRDNYANTLALADVVVIADRDDAGRAHAQTVVASLRAVGARVHLVEPAVGKDITDHLNSGRHLEEAITIDPAPTPPAATAGDAAADPDIALAIQRHVFRLRVEHEAREQHATHLAEQAKARAADGARVRDGGTFLLDLPPTPLAMWGADTNVLWARGEALLVAGPQGVGKTTIAGQLLRATLGLGTREVLGYPVAQATNRVLYLAMDRPQQAQRNLGRMFAAEEREFLADILRFWIGPPPADFATAPETLLHLANEHDADIVFIDSLKDAAIGLSKDEIGAAYNRARQLALAEGIQVVELHHMVKNSPDGRAPRHLKDVYGSGWLTAGAGSVILLWGEPGDPVVELHHLKQPMDEIGPLHLVHDRVTGTTNVFHDPDTDVIALARRCAQTGLSAREAAACIYSVENPSKAQIEKARRKLATYVAERLLIFRPGPGHTAGRGSGDRWYPTAPSSWETEEKREWYR